MRQACGGFSWLVIDVEVAGKSGEFPNGLVTSFSICKVDRTGSMMYLSFEWLREPTWEYLRQTPPKKYLRNYCIIYCGWYHPWNNGPGMCRKASWAKHRKMSHSVAFLHGLGFSSCLQVLALFQLTCPDRVWLGIYKLKKPCPAQVASSHGVLPQPWKSKLEHWQTHI